MMQRNLLRPLGRQRGVKRICDNDPRAVKGCLDFRFAFDAHRRIGYQRVCTFRRDDHTNRLLLCGR